MSPLNKQQLCVGRFERFQKFKPQQTALAGGFLLIFCSGIHIGYGFFHWNSLDMPWSRSLSSAFVAFAAVAWFMGGILGFILAPSTLKFLNKQVIYLVSNSFVALSAILLIVFPQFYYSVFFGRFLAGIGHGLSYVPLVQHFGEICDDKSRGRVGTSLHLFFLKGGVISGSAVINFLSKEGRMDPNRFFGIVTLLLSTAGILMTLVFYKESIVTLMKLGRDRDAMKTLMLIRGVNTESPEIIETFNEFKLMVVEDKYTDYGIFSGGNLKPLMVVLWLRVSFALTFNFALKYIHIYMTENSNSGINYSFILNLVHTFTVVTVMFTIDKGRRKHFLLSGCGTSAILIIFGFQRVSKYANTDLLVFTMFVLFEFFSAIGMGLTAHIYSTEAFPTAKKPASIAFTSIIEFCIQIFFIVWVDNQIYPKLFNVILLLSSGLALTGITTYLYFNLPETKLMSIRKAKIKFLQ